MAMDDDRMMVSQSLSWAAENVARSIRQQRNIPGHPKPVAMRQMRRSWRRFDWERSGLVRERSIAMQCLLQVAVPYLRYVRAALTFSAGVSIAPNLLGGPDDLEDSEDCRGAGGHGNQHVRLRSTQVDCIETICPALAALCCFEPRQTSGSGFPVRD